MRKLFISFVTAVLLASCSADSLMKETELDLTDTEKVYSDITLTRKVAYDLYARMRMGRDRLGSFGFLANIGGSPCMLDNATDDGAGNTTRAGGAVIPELEKFIKGGIDASKGLIGGDHPWIFYYKRYSRIGPFRKHIPEQRRPFTIGGCREDFPEKPSTLSACIVSPRTVSFLRSISNRRQRTRSVTL